MMEWHELYAKEKKPSLADMAEFIGGNEKLIWQDALDWFEKEMRIKPTLTYSTCSGKPGWNIKLKKSGKSFGTLYPEKGSFSILMVVSYNHCTQLEEALPSFSPEIAEAYEKGGDFMKIGRYLMFQVKRKNVAEDYKKIVELKRG